MCGFENENRDQFQCNHIWIKRGPSVMNWHSSRNEKMNCPDAQFVAEINSVWIRLRSKSQAQSTQDVGCDAHRDASKWDLLM